MLWIAGIAVTLVWNRFFLIRSDFILIETALVQSMMTSVLAVVLAAGMAWIWINLEEWARRNNINRFRTLMDVVYDVQKSAPQVIGLLIGYSLLTVLIRTETLRNTFWMMAWMSSCLALVTAAEFAELFRERIGFFRQKDFFPAMRVCGLSEFRIINRDILWYNSRAFLLQKGVSLFGVVLFLQCSIDFIISVGLANDISSANFPSSLGSVLARMSSKQDILAIGMSLADPSSVPALFTEHLMGISAAALLVWTLICIFQIAHELTQRSRL